MKKSGLADSPFFSRPQSGASATVFPAEQPQEQVAIQHVPDSPKPKPSKQPARRGNKQPGSHGTTVSRYRDTTVDTTIPRYHDTTIEGVRRAVKEFGKEAATHRFTAAEKQAIAEVIYAYKSRGLRTSENEIARIAINFIIHDYKENKDDSILDQVLKALNG